MTRCALVSTLKASHRGLKADSTLIAGREGARRRFQIFGEAAKKGYVALTVGYWLASACAP
jgi:hypothetical protein